MNNVVDYAEGVELDGYISGMPDDVYHKTPGFVSKSTLAKLEKLTPFRFLNEKPKPSTPAMKIGTALHCSILEPEKFCSNYVLLPNVKAKTLKAYKDAVSESNGADVINGQDAANILGMVEAVYNNQYAKELLDSDGWNEVSGFHTDSATGLGIRHRFDKLTKSGIGVDLKKTQSVAPDDISKTINDYRYDMQAALYSDAYKAITGEDLSMFVFIFVEEKHPHQVALVYLDDISLHVGRERYIDLLWRYKEVIESKSDINNNNSPEMISLPEWVLRQYENELEDGGIF